MEHFYHNLGENWFSYPDLYKTMVDNAKDGDLFVEVGSFKGRSSACMAVEIINSEKKIKFDCVDIWEYTDKQSDLAPEMFDNLYETFIRNIFPVRDFVFPIKMLSTDAARLYENSSIDFIFIDAAHDFDNVWADLNAWYPKLKKGGIIAGHDYGTGWVGVKMAVDKFFRGDIKVVCGDCWVYENF